MKAYGKRDMLSLASHPLNMALHKNLSVLLKPSKLAGDHPPFCEAMQTICESQRPGVNYHDELINARPAKDNYFSADLSVI